MLSFGISSFYGVVGTCYFLVKEMITAFQQLGHSLCSSFCVTSRHAFYFWKKRIKKKPNKFIVWDVFYFSDIKLVAKQRKTECINGFSTWFGLVLWVHLPNPASLNFVKAVTRKEGVIYHNPVLLFSTGSYSYFPLILLCVGLAYFHQSKAWAADNFWYSIYFIVENNMGFFVRFLEHWPNLTHKWGGERIVMRTTFALFKLCMKSCDE